MKMELKELVRSECAKIGDQLKKHVKQGSFKMNIKSRFYANKDMDLSTESDFSDVEDAVRKHIFYLIGEEVEAWEQSSKHYDRTLEMVKEAFENKCQALRESYLEVEHFIEDISEPASRECMIYLNKKYCKVTQPEDMS
ncbi:hypothetical protein DPMN_155525 [Dreissena polymorpha]|uniref:Uncharacterized protein n=1 Tax=Dreissena polymorpha TaxID=45954 RepID=A0A9D4FN15_DREPO|nr:hypothetical protein DPMN_155525 [Dreissena polymorpha]